MSLTQDELQGLQLYVASFHRVDALSRNVVFNAVYDGESSMFSVVVASETPQVKDFYINKAFRQLRSTIRDWVRSESMAGSVVGRQYVYSLEEWNEQDVVDE